jgi:hypothetical protein
MATFEVITAAQIGGGSASSGYLSYVATITQTGTDAPVATVLENTLSGGAVVWTRQGEGVFEGTSIGSFTVGKTIIPYGSNWAGDAFFMIPICDAGAAILGYMSLTCSNANVLLLQIFNAALTQNIDWSTISGGSNIMLPPIYIYP